MSGFAHLVVAASLLGAAAWDLYRREIPDSCSVAIMIAAALLGVVQTVGWLAALSAVSAALALFAAGAGLFRAGIVGGGDVKLVAALGAWFGWSGLPGFLLLMALFGGALAMVIMGLRAARIGERSWLAADRGVPYGVAIAAAGVILPGGFS